MTARMGYILAGLAGVAIVVGLLLIGADLRRAVETGPRWRRRIVAIALVLLGAVGMTSSLMSHAERVENARLEYERGMADPNLATNVLWTELIDTWHEAEEIGSGRRGDYPFSASGKKRFLGELAGAEDKIDELCWRGFLVDAEVALLKQELGRVTQRVQGRRTTEEKMTSCYAPSLWTPGQDSMKRLAARLPLLKKLATVKKLQRPVLDKVLRTVKDDLAVLSYESLPRDLDETEREQAIAIRDEVRAQLELIQAHLRGKATNP